VCRHLSDVPAKNRPKAKKKKNRKSASASADFPKLGKCGIGTISCPPPNRIPFQGQNCIALFFIAIPERLEIDVFRRVYFTYPPDDRGSARRPVGFVVMDAQTRPDTVRLLTAQVDASRSRGWAH